MGQELYVLKTRLPFDCTQPKHKIMPTVALNA